MSLQSFLQTQSDRRKTFLRLAGDIESQLRDAYDRRFHAGKETQASVAEKLGINRSAVHRRLMGHTNMTIETIADMVWALGCKIVVKIDDAADDTNHPVKTADQCLQLKPLSSAVTDGNLVDDGGSFKFDPKKMSAIQSPSLQAI